MECLITPGTVDCPLFRRKTNLQRGRNLVDVFDDGVGLEERCAVFGDQHGNLACGRDFQEPLGLALEFDIFDFIVDVLGFQHGGDALDKRADLETYDFHHE